MTTGDVRPASECPQDAYPVMAWFAWEADGVEPCVMRRLGPGFWTNMVGDSVGTAPDRWRPLTDTEREELTGMFPDSMPQIAGGDG